QAQGDTARTPTGPGRPPGRWRAALALILALGAIPAPARAAAPGGLPIGVSYSGWRGGFADAEKRVATFSSVGFALITFVPAYAYVGRNRVDHTAGPTADELAAAMTHALRAGRQVVVKPHLEPLVHRPGYQRATSDNHSWRAETGWRGFFDVDPMTPDYREGVVFTNLRAVKQAISAAEAAGVAAASMRPIRFELGAELMNSIVEFADRWQALGQAARAERKRLGLDGRVLFSHNFSHHIEIPEDQIDRMSPRARAALARYLSGLDALAVSQYMDLTVAMPKDELPVAGKGRLPTVDEVAEALRTHERNFRTNVLQGALKLPAKKIPPLHIGEFGVGAGGLRHPNLWGGPARTAEQERQLAAEVARGHEGLVRYLSEDKGRTAETAVLWVTGPQYDIFGWRNPAYGIPAAADAIRAGLAPK
ncbi:MAG TPA: hypothetical protein VGF45_17855, partial [Polyangia bacterium]